jgi:hypothetical protein
MKRRDILSLSVTAILTGLVSLLIANAIFQTPQNRRTEVPTAAPISPTFPDVKNDPVYKSFLNENALDPTHPIQIGESRNRSPFNTR